MEFEATTPEFSVFSKLPAEVRLMIWKQALSGPRLIDVYFHFRDKKFSFGSDLLSLTSPCPPPTLLSVCQESRMVAKTRYKLCFAADAGKAMIYFDEQCDTLHIPYYDTINLLTSLSVVDAFSALSFTWLRHLALGLGPCVDSYNPIDYVDLVLTLPNLKTFTIVCQDEEEEYSRDSLQENHIEELDTKNEPEGTRQRVTTYMGERLSLLRSLQLPGGSHKAPELKFGKVSKK